MTSAARDGVDFLVREYLEGETLAARLARKPLAVDEALKITIEIADALEKAHRNASSLPLFLSQQG
jgi:eukaryotic-like serine/threonine-protein kinase